MSAAQRFRHARPLRSADGISQAGSPVKRKKSACRRRPARGRLSFVSSACLFMLSWNKIRKREGTRDMKKTWHTVFLILLICLDAALLLLPLLPGYRALFDIGPYPGRPAARVPLPETGRLCPVFPSDGIRLRQAAGAHPQAPAPLAAGGGLCADRHGAGLPAQQRAAHALPAGQRLGTRAAYV